MNENLKRHRPDIKVLGEGKAIAFMPEDPMGVWCHIQEVRDLLDVKDKEIARLDDLAHAHNLELLQKENCIAELKDKLRHYPMMVALLENDKKEIEERNAIHQKSLARLHELARKTYPDQEEDHCEADGILCDMLNALGYKDLTDAYDKIGKWYS